MKKIIVIIILLIISIVIKSSNTHYVKSDILPNVTLAWDANDEPDLVGYMVWQHIDDGYILLDEIQEIDLPDSLNPVWTTQVIHPNEKAYFVVSAFNDTNESEFSNEVCGVLENNIYVPCKIEEEKEEDNNFHICFISTVTF